MRGVLSLIGLPVYFDGLHFQIPAGVFEIAGGCSGLHFFIVGIAIAVFYGELHRDRLATRVKLVALAIVMALLTNWLRIAIIIIAGHLTDMRHYLVSGEHYTFGWAMFAVAMTIYFLIVRRWTAEAAVAAAAPAPAAPLAPLGVALACITLALPGLWQWLDTNRASAESVARGDLPRAVAGWREVAAPPEPRPAEFINADGFAARTFYGDGAPVDVYRAFYLHQEQGRELAGYANRPQGPDMQARSNVVAPDGRWREIKAQYLDGDDWLVWYVYRVGESRYVDALRAQLRYGVASLGDNPVSAALVLRTRCVRGLSGGARAPRAIRARIGNGELMTRRGAMRPLVAMCVLLLLVGCDRFASPETRVERADAAMAAGNYGVAVVELKNALQKKPDFDRAHLLLAEAALWLGDARGAEQELGRIKGPVDEKRRAEVEIRARARAGQGGRSPAAPHQQPATAAARQTGIAQGYALMRLARFREAQQAFEAAAAADGKLDRGTGRRAGSTLRAGRSRRRAGGSARAYPGAAGVGGRVAHLRSHAGGQQRFQGDHRRAGPRAKTFRAADSGAAPGQPARCAGRGAVAVG